MAKKPGAPLKGADSSGAKDRGAKPTAPRLGVPGGSGLTAAVRDAVAASTHVSPAAAGSAGSVRAEAAVQGRLGSVDDAPLRPPVLAAIPAKRPEPKAAPCASSAPHPLLTDRDKGQDAIAAARAKLSVPVQTPPRPVEAAIPTLGNGSSQSAGATGTATPTPAILAQAATAARAAAASGAAAVDRAAREASEAAAKLAEDAAAAAGSLKAAGLGEVVAEAARANLDAAMGMMRELATARTPSDLLRLQTAFARRQIELALSQSRAIGGAMARAGAASMAPLTAFTLRDEDHEG